MKTNCSKFLNVCSWLVGCLGFTASQPLGYFLWKSFSNRIFMCLTLQKALLVHARCLHSINICVSPCIAFHIVVYSHDKSKFHQLLNSLPLPSDSNLLLPYWWANSCSFTHFEFSLWYTSTYLDVLSILLC